MIEANKEHLEKNLKYAGFGEGLYSELERQLTKGDHKFSIGFETEINKRKVEATLHFAKGDKSDLYFFNSYDMRTSREKNDETVQQTFYMSSKGNGVTVKEAYNMLNERYALRDNYTKEGEKYQAWQGLDMSGKNDKGQYERKSFHENFGYDIKEVLSYFPVKEMKQEDTAEHVIASLEKGNQQYVTMEKDGKEVKLFIAADPAHRTLAIHGTDGKKLNAERVNELMVKPDGKQVDKKEKTALLPKKEDNGLLKQKKSSPSKGMGVH